MVRPINFADTSSPNWIGGGTLSFIIDKLAMAWPLWPVLNTCHPSIGCRRHLVPPSPLLQLGRLSDLLQTMTGLAPQ